MVHPKTGRPTYQTARHHIPKDLNFNIPASSPGHSFVKNAEGEFGKVLMPALESV